MPTLVPLRQLEVVAEDCIGEVLGPNYNWEPQLKGQLQLRDYQGEDLSKVIFLGEEDRQFVLGTRKAGREEPLSDHWDVVEPLRDRLEPILLRYARGGAKFFGLFATNQYVDDDFRISEKETASDVRFALGIWNDVAKRRTRMMVGFFRVICLNGLFSQVLGLDHASFTHQELVGTDLSKFYNEALTSSPARHDPANYPALLPGQSLRRIAPLLTETEGRGPIPDELRSLVSPIARCPKWFTENLQAQLLMAEPGASYSSLQLVNLTTNAVAERVPDERPGWFYWRQDQIIQALWKLTMIASFFAS